MRKISLYRERNGVVFIAQPAFSRWLFYIIIFPIELSHSFPHRNCFLYGKEMYGKEMMIRISSYDQYMFITKAI